MKRVAGAKHMRNDRRAAFSLVELSIVLVILGLLVGGILGGQSLIKAAELRGITTELSEWRTAAYGFKTRYGSLPGDFRKATNLWGAADTCPTPEGGEPLGDSTCNGNGNGHVGGIYESEITQESFLFWQHLAFGGFIGGNFSGVAGGEGRSHHIIGENAPTSRYPNGGWSIYYVIQGSTNQYERDYGNALIFGAQRTPYATNGKILLPEEAWSIDNKLDDGHPALGNIVAHWIRDECASADSGTSDKDNLEAHYRLEDDTPQCSLYFLDVM